MPRFRLFLAWLLLAALPLQGWAAATMLYCGPAKDAAIHEMARSAQATGHHDTHAAHHDVQAAQTPHHHADAAGADASGDGPQIGSHATPHTCGVCAACCHGVALAQTPHWPAITAAPRADLAEPLVVVLALPSPVPDKPPRA